MFTGIVEIIGTVLEYQELDVSASGGNGVSLTITDASKILSDVHIGDSIAINGTCLTVTEFTNNDFKVGIAPETLKKTNLGSLKKGSKVNLERAMTGETRFGGHMVQGHVDTVAEIVSSVPEGNAIVYTFKLRDPEFIKYVVHKGFICVDGTSLTVTNVNDDAAEFSIMMIKHTQENVVLPLKKLGDFVNIEVDLAGKLIEKQVQVALDNEINSDNSPLINLITRIVQKVVKEQLA
ncbi:Riboflavin synthase [Komagataella phaffii CBS 7435]|uniref:Riboflavin synthase n=2 Tax=Komagataella phaffii TaxID=460519 RepID=C4R6T2_KOMPG|nr:Riboflavin synthase [Komagataella phaffii GS115]AOA64382.1 GQ67_04389T0 [Komagataella phaffii]CAH2451349.1 Riboflavin synthase [Komagataella phaffii CBS 7435]CAY71307.1 Riboflavin synthase [Komagataella phaffii GS115]CCA41087.2 Riboflavin synthase [Komagataella phaffii CBS 7435]